MVGPGKDWQREARVLARALAEGVLEEVDYAEEEEN
jgi:hypothetical protein